MSARFITSNGRLARRPAAGESAGDRTATPPHGNRPPRRSLRWACGVAIVTAACTLSVILAALPAAAHNRSQSFSSWSIAAGNIRALYTVKAREVSRLPWIDGESPTATEEALMRALEARLIAHLTENILVREGGEPCPQSSAPLALVAGEGELRIELNYRCPGVVAPQVTIDAFFAGVPSHVHLARVRTTGEAPTEFLFTDPTRSHHFETAPDASSGGVSPGTATIGGYLALGFRHILAGYDHIAFLFTLLLLCRSLREVVFMVSGFTVGHSITLSLAALSLVRADATVIEALIGFTIAIVAAENVGVITGANRRIAAVACALLAGLTGAAYYGNIELPTVTLAGLCLFAFAHLSLSDSREQASRWRPALTLLFGMVHGFGFANVLFDVGLPQDRLVRALLGFNLGVEFGQLAIVATFWVVGRALLKRASVPARNGVIEFASSALCGLGVFWFVSRAL